MPFKNEKLSREVVKFERDFVEGYLRRTIRLMRLFKEGDIRIPLMYYYFIENNKPRMFLKHEGTGPYTIEPYTIESLELPELQRFAHETQLPFEKPFLQLAFENFELTYRMLVPINLMFLTLMTCLETLLNPGEHELRYRISRNVAVLLGRDREDAKKIFSQIKRLYDKRSEVVHTGKPGVISEEDFQKLRYYVRESIKKISAIGKNKDEILAMLNSCGFGEKLLA